MTVEDVIRTHTEGFNRALTMHDLDALSAIYADDYMLVRPDGSVLGKQDVLRDLGVGGPRFTSIELANVSVRIYDQTALLTGDSRTITSRNGVEMTARTRTIWPPWSRSWICAARFTSGIDGPDHGGEQPRSFSISELDRSNGRPRRRVRGCAGTLAG
jgi:hypothetical protein